MNQERTNSRGSVAAGSILKVVVVVGELNQELTEGMEELLVWKAVIRGTHLNGQVSSVMNELAPSDQLLKLLSDDPKSLFIRDVTVAVVAADIAEDLRFVVELLDLHVDESLIVDPIEDALSKEQTKTFQIVVV